MVKSKCKVMACFDTETSNCDSTRSAYAITYQLSVLKSHLVPCDSINNDNVNGLLDITVDRFFDDVCKRFDELIRYGKANGIIPVVMVHNLAFEMWIISSYVSKHEADGCSKSTVKPLTINIKENGENVLVFWDTLSFWQKSLGKLGDECKYPKLTGCWDYSIERTPHTVLTDEELAYAREDVVVPWAYLGYYLRLNPEINEHDLACKILTKTSTVRYKSTKRCGNIRIGKATTQKIWINRNKLETPKSDYELEIMHAATRGGFTYCARKHASVCFHGGNGRRILKYDANSMHICHALSHKVPINYRKCGSEWILKSLNYVSTVTPEQVLENYSNPFLNSKFFAKVRFTNVRLKKGTVFYKNEISTFASSRFRRCGYNSYLIETNEGGMAFDECLFDKGWHDWASDDAKFAFGKFYGASECVLILNELSAWEFFQQFSYDSMEVVGDGYWTGKTDYATHKSILSFNEFYKAKTIFKKLKGAYDNGTIGDYTEDDFPTFVPDYLRDAMLRADKDFNNDVESFYLSVKAELNALYGIEATNEAKNEVLLTKNGYELDEYRGIEALPKLPKAWYQYGTHIVGWSRVHQILFMHLLKDKVDAFICGDTDSHKIYTRCTVEEIEEALKPLHDACDKALLKCTEKAREVKEWFPMKGLGWYECEGECDALCASWNKSYMQLSHGRIDITMAGVPCDSRIYTREGCVIDHSYNRVANYLYETNGSFDDVANVLLGYNVTITSGITGLNQRSLPEWGAFDPIYNQPMAIYIYPEYKEIGSTRVVMNHDNSLYARRNNASVNIDKTVIDWPLGSCKPVIIRMGE